jgi:hypothetical protein
VSAPDAQDQTKILSFARTLLGYAERGEVQMIQASYVVGDGVHQAVLGLAPIDHHVGMIYELAEDLIEAHEQSKLARTRHRDAS